MFSKGKSITKIKSWSRHELREILMKQLISENFAKRSVICNVLLILLLFIPVLMGLWGVVATPIMMCEVGLKNSFVYYSIIEINVVIALLAAYGFILKNKKVALAFGLTTLYSILIFISPFFTTESGSVEEITGSDYWRDFIDSFVICLVICLIVLGVLILPLLIKKRGKSALSLLEKGGVITNVKIEILVVIISNIALIVTTYMMVLSEMNRLGSH